MAEMRRIGIRDSLPMLSDIVLLIGFGGSSVYG